MAERGSREELKVFVVTGDDSGCDECGEELGRGRWLTLTGERTASRALCIPCADLDYLVFLAAGDAALTRRAKKHSRLHAVLLRWSSARRRYERQGLLVEEAALERAEAECLEDADARAAAAERRRERAAELDHEHAARFAAAIRSLYPRLPAGREQAIAEHACLRSSGRVGRSVGGKELDSDLVSAAVVAHARHTETRYDELLGSGRPRDEARDEVREELERVLARWR